MRRALLATIALGAGCSLQAGGTAQPIDLVDSSIDVVAEATVEPDTGTPPLEDSIVDTTVLDDTFEAPEVIDPGCPAGKAGAKPCDEIPMREALATGQTMDGSADDFCDVPFVDFDNTKGAIRVPGTIPGAAHTTMRIRVAWSSYGVHAHLAVKDDTLLPRKPLTDKLVFLGDSVEIYIAGYDALTGDFDGTSKDIGAQQIVFSAPDATTMSRAVYFYGGTALSSPDITRWSARVTAAGYEIELRLPWSDLKPTSLPMPTTGKRIALTWAFNNKYTSTDPQAWSVFQVKTPYPSPSPCGSDAQPYCDDRLWCTPVLL